MQRRELAVAAEDRLGHLAGKLVVGVDHERVGAALVEADHGGDALREQREAAGHQAGIGAVRAHGRDQGARAGREADAIGNDLVDDGGRQAREQRHPLAQRRRELDLPAHGALGDRGDMRLHPDIIGKLVDAFLADHGGIHVGEEKPLAPAARTLHDDVDRSAGQRRAHAIGEGAAVA